MDEGPWRLDDESAHGDVLDDEYHAIDAGDGFSGHGFEITAFMSLADAHLIAAAPALAEALDGLLAACVTEARSNFFAWDPEKEPEVIAARAALSLARGEKGSPATLLNVETKEPEL